MTDFTNIHTLDIPLSTSPFEAFQPRNHEPLLVVPGHHIFRQGHSQLIALWEGTFHANPDAPILPTPKTPKSSNPLKDIQIRQTPHLLSTPPRRNNDLLIIEQNPLILSLNHTGL